MCIYVCVSVYVLESEIERERVNIQCYHYLEYVNKVIIRTCLKKFTRVDIVLHTEGIFRTHLWACDNINNSKFVLTVYTGSFTIFTFDKHLKLMPLDNGQLKFSSVWPFVKLWLWILILSFALTEWTHIQDSYTVQQA